MHNLFLLKKKEIVDTEIEDILKNAEFELKNIQERNKLLSHLKSMPNKDYEAIARLIGEKFLVDKEVSNILMNLFDLIIVLLSLIDLLYFSSGAKL